MDQRFARDGPTASVRMGEVCPACFTETTENVLVKQPTPSQGLEKACAMFYLRGAVEGRLRGAERGYGRVAGLG